jgi:UDP-glucose 4-epimerase
LKWLEKIYNIKYVIFRYFNVAGGSFDGTIGEDHKHESHLIPLVLQVPLGYRKKVSVFGNDYPTRDGTCIRDYIHVNDIAHAHLCAAKYLKNVNMSNHFNLGAGKGYSVLEVIKCCRMVTEHSIPAEIKPRRHGDAIEIYSSIHKASCVLGWIPQYSKIDNIIKSAWIFHYTHPNGYED